MTKTVVALLLGLGASAAAFSQPATGKDHATGSTRVALSIPAVHGFDAPEGAPEGGGRYVSKTARRTPESKLRVAMINTNAGDALMVRRTVLSAGDAASVVPTARGRESATAPTTETSSFVRAGAFGWRRLEDRVEGPLVQRVSSRDREELEAVVYELWHF
jgi:hypothetical protein